VRLASASITSVIEVIHDAGGVNVVVNGPMFDMPNPDRVGDGIVAERWEYFLEYLGLITRDLDYL
jgi:hypothetical protein